MKKRLFLILLILLLSCCKNDDNIYDIKGDVIPPHDTKVIFHFKTYGNKTRLSDIAKVFSQIYYYDAKGNELGDFSIKREVHGDIFQQTNDGITITFNECNITTNYEEYNVFYQTNATNHITIRQVGKGPYYVDYIKSRDITFSIINAGSGKEHYNTILRFTTSDNMYEIIIPDFVIDLVYIKEQDKFIYRTPKEDFIDDKYIYRYIIFDETKEQYVLDEGYHFSKNKDNKEFIGLDYLSYYSSCVVDNMMYLVSSRYCDDDLKTMERLQNANDDSIELFKPEKGIIVIAKLNLETNIVEEVIQVSKELLNNDKNRIFATNSQPFPSFKYGNKIYMFTYDNYLYTYDCVDGSVEKLKMLYDFEDSVSKYRIGDKNYTENTQFGSIYKFEEDGNIYIGNAYSDGKLRIHKMNSDGVFELFWESAESIPDMKKGNMGINTFEIIN